MVEKLDFNKVAEEVRAYWDEKQVPQNLAKHREGRPKYFLLDGPPYVNALPHVGHVKTTVCKDVWTRFKQMQGFDCFIQPGFDCHGLPVEVVVQKELGVQTKKDIEKMGIDKFDAACLAKILDNERHWMEYYRLLGAWRAYFDPYFTYKNYYIESAWWTLKRLHEKGFLVKGETPTHWCPQCETVLSGYEVSDSYKDVSDPSVFLKFKVKGKENEFLIVWTTTPWTLAANVALFVHGDEDYVKAKVKTDAGEELFVLGKKLADKVLKEKLGFDYEVVEEFKGAKLEGVEYEPLLDVEQQNLLGKKAHRVYLSIPIMKFKQYKKHETKNKEGKEEEEEKGKGKQEFDEFVTMDEGTGIVHCAPGHGASDHFVGTHCGLPAVSPVDEQGKFTNKAGQFAGKFVKDADDEIMKWLKDNGKLLLSEKIVHSYPLCWRCKTPLVFRLSTQWYLKIEFIKEKLLKANQELNWMPAYGKQAFHNWLENSTDWCISRQRYWAIPMPIWACESCGRFEVVGSASELRAKATKDVGELDDLHRHSVDKIFLRCAACKSKMKRIPDVFDVWYDSGIAPWASLGYPNQNRELFEAMFPVDLVNESQDQIRGWFYTLMFAAMAAFDKPSFKNVAMMGWVVDEKGQKMSKSIGNVVYAKEGIEKMGADVIRLYYCSDIAPWDVQKFSFDSAKESKRALTVFWNTLQFFETYKPEGFKASPPRPESVEDKWILSRLNTVAKEVTEHMEKFEFHHAGRGLSGFLLNDFSRWYVKLCRDRMSPSAPAEEKKACADVFFHVLHATNKLLAPITPFFSEKVFLTLKPYAGEGSTEEKRDSVHHCRYTEPVDELVNPELEERMSLAMKITEGSHALRKEAGLKLRWPAKELVVTGDDKTKQAVELLQEVLKKSNNALSVLFAEAEPTTKMPFKEFEGGKVFLDAEQGEDLKNRALFRELVRCVQDSRKKNGFSVGDKIVLSVQASDSKFNAFLEGGLEELKKEVGASQASVGEPAGEFKASVKALGTELKAGFSKA